MICQKAAVAATQADMPDAVARAAVAVEQAREKVLERHGHYLALVLFPAQA